MRLIADAMLGKLARWLRLLGYDTLYDATLADAAIVRLARSEERVILTRDTQLAQRSGICVIYIKSENLEQQLGQLLSLPTLTASPGPRCPRCNHPLTRVSLEEAWSNVPLHTFASHSDFSRCNGCAQYYWHGSHWGNINSTLARISRVDIESHQRYNGKNDYQGG